MQRIRQHYSLLPPVIKFLLVSNSLIFILEGMFPNLLLGLFALWPVHMPVVPPHGVPVQPFYPWQLISYGFLHGSLGHLFLNMYALWLFGVGLENMWGSRRFAIYYLVCVVGAAITQLVVIDIGGEWYAGVGAAGGVVGVLLGGGLLFPKQIVLLLIPPIPIKAKWFVLIYGVVELVFGITGTEAGVAHFAHLGGMLFGFMLIYYWTVEPPPPSPGN